MRIICYFNFYFHKAENVKSLSLPHIWVLFEGTNLINIQVYLITEVNHCEPDPCKNGGTCSNYGNNLVCHCDTAYTGKSNL